MFVAVLGLSLILGPVAPVFVSTAHAVPAITIFLPASGGTYGPTTYTTSENWGPGPVSCGYSYDTQGGSDGSGWTPIPCDNNTPIPAPGTEGEHTLYISAWDGADYTGSQYQRESTFTYDATVPSVSISTPADAAEIADASWANPTASWGDSATCEYHLDSDSYAVPASDCGGTVIVPKPAAGGHTLYVRGTDAAGNQTEQSISFTLGEPGSGPSLPTVTTGSVTSITDTTATGMGSTTDNGGGTITDSGIAYDTVSAPSGNYASYGSQVHAVDPTATDISAEFTALSCSTTYYYRAFATNAAGTSVGTESSFETATCGGVPDPDVTPPTVSIVTPQPYSVGAFLPNISWGDSDTCEYSYDGITYATIVDCISINIPEPESTGSYTLYVVGTDASANASTPVSVIFSFDATLPPAVTGAASSITQTSAILASEGHALEGETLDHIGLQYATDEYYQAHEGSYDQSGGQVNGGGSVITYGFSIGSLTCGTTYHYRATAYNEGGPLGYGGDETFATSACDIPPFGGGEGTTESPYLISTCEDLALVNDHLDSVFELTENLSCAASGNDITIGVADPFTGILDGAGHSISLEKTAISGLFFHTSGATIKNLGLGGSVAAGGAAIGALVGLAQNTAISFVFSTTTVTSSGGDQVGGLVGNLEGGSIRNSYATGEVTGQDNSVGGLVGIMSNALITKSYAAGAVHGTYYVGALVGSSSGDSTISASFAAGGISSAGGYGGLVGVSDSTVLIQDYYDAGRMEVGGCTSNSPSGCTAVNGDGLSPAYFFNDNTNSPFTYWDFTSVWQANADTYPTLRTNPSDNSIDITSYDGGAGTVTDPYQLDTCEQLQSIGQDDAHLAAHYVFVDDVYCTDTGTEGTALNHNGAGFDPIGDVDHPFIGSLDGDGYSIYNMTIDRPEESTIGIFAKLLNATVEHLYIHQAAVTGSELVGLVAGYAVDSTLHEVETGFSQSVTADGLAGGLIGIAEQTNIIDSNYDGAIGANYTIGGLVGAFSGDSEDPAAFGITNSHSSASVTALADSTQYGGLVGYMTHAFVENSYVDANGYPVIINGNTHHATRVGGLVGHALDVSISNSRANVTVSGYGSVGGLIGYDQGDVTITSSFTTGTAVAGSSESRIDGIAYVGGLVGYSGQDDSISHSYSASNVTVYVGNFLNHGVGGLVGELCEDAGGCELYDSYATGNVLVDAETSDGGGTIIYGIGGLVGALNTASAPSDFARNYATGNVTVTMPYNATSIEQSVYDAGGLYGYTQGNGTLTSSFASGNVTVTAPGGADHGGFAGEIDNEPTVTNSFSSGTVSVTAVNGAAEVGGFTGYISSGSLIDVSYASGDVLLAGVGASFSHVGGFVGTQGGTIHNSFAAGSVSTPPLSTDMGGFVGTYNANILYDSLINDYYAFGSTTASSQCVGSDGEQQENITYEGTLNCTGIDPVNLGSDYFYIKTHAPMADSWNFTSNGAWIEHADTTPTLRGLPDPLNGSDQFEGGDGSAEDPYQIGSCAALTHISSDLEASYELIRDITCTNFVPIGLNIDGGFYGNFDGGGHSVTLTINDTSNNYIGLFSGTNQAYVHDLTVHGFVVGTGTNVGALVGYSVNSRIEHVSSDAVVIGQSTVGGLLGRNYGGRLNDLNFTGTVEGENDYIGGVIGEADSGLLFNLYATSTVSGRDYVGGLIGYVNSADIAGGASTGGSVTGRNHVGGAFGGLEQDGNIVQSIKSSANVTGKEDVGGLVGSFSWGTLQDSYAYDATVNGYRNTGGLVGSASNATIRRSYSEDFVWGNGFNYDQTNRFVGGLVGIGSENLYVQNSFAKGSVSFIIDYDEFGPVFNTEPQNAEFYGAFYGYTYSTDAEHNTNNYFDVIRTGHSYCDNADEIPNCTGINTGGVPDDEYFINNSVNAPLDNWNFDTVWATDEEGAPQLLLPLTVDLITPVVLITTPEDESTVFGTWSPVVDWGSSTRCSYSFNENEPIDVDCSQEGADIPAPADGQNLLLVRGTNISDISSSWTESNFTYFADPFSFISGDGSSETPYVVNSCEALTAIEQRPSAHYELSTDLSCGAFNPIAPDTGFSGTFDGNGHTITYTQTDANAQNGGDLGLFGFLDGARVENLSLAGSVSTSGDAYPGGLASYSYGTTTISGVHSAVTVAGEYYVGGLFSYATDNLTIEKSYVSGATSGIEYVGGFVGDAEVSTLNINDSYMSGTVSESSDAVGGFVGYLSGTATMNRSYFSGSISSDDDAGGLFGDTYNATITIADSFVQGSIQVASGNPYKGSLISYLTLGQTTITNSWYDSAATGVGYCGTYGDYLHYADSEGGCQSAISSTQFKGNSTQHPFENWDFTDVWQVNANAHPTLRSNYSEDAGAPSITILGQNPVRVVRGSTYTDAGATASDENDGDITGSITTTSTVNTAVVGTYTVTYRVEDAAHNEAEAVRTVEVTRASSGHSSGSTAVLSTATRTESLSRLQSLLEVLLHQYKVLTGGSFTAADATPASGRDLSIGARGSDVAALQALLIEENTGSAAQALRTITATGFFSTATRDALIEYQKAHAITPASGYFGSRTRAVMKAKGTLALWW